MGKRKKQMRKIDKAIKAQIRPFQQSGAKKWRY